MTKSVDMKQFSCLYFQIDFVMLNSRCRCFKYIYFFIYSQAFFVQAFFVLAFLGKPKFSLALLAGGSIQPILTFDISQIRMLKHF